MAELRLCVRDHTGQVSSTNVDHFPFTLGRGVENDLVLAEPSVSRNHAFFRHEADVVSIVNNKSRNGVFVNRERVRDECPIVAGDVIKIGSFQIQLLARDATDVPWTISGGETVRYLSSENVPSQKSWDLTDTSLSPLVGGGDERLSNPGHTLSWVYKLFAETPLPEVYEEIFNLVESVAAFDRCYVILFDESCPDGMDIAARRTRGSGVDKPGVIVSKEILCRVAQSGEAVLVDGNRPFVPSESFILSGASTAICVPLMIQGRVTGVLYLDRLSSDRILTQKDIESIGPLAGFVAMKIENMRLTQSHVRSQILLRDLELAKSIQEGLHPRDTVRLQSFQFEGFSEPCYEVGGDYYDLLARDTSSVMIVMSDVSGKGLSSALYMAGVRSALHAHWEDGLQLAHTMSRLEGHARRTFRDNFFLTMVLGEIDASGRFRYCNAGHLPPVVISANGETRELEGSDPALNVLDVGEFQQYECDLVPGDLLFLFTDGLVEAQNSAGEQFGCERLCAVASKHRNEDLAALRRKILEEVVSFADSDRPGDDRTLILVKRP